MERIKLPHSSIPPNNCINSICFQHYQELQDTIVKLRQELLKAHEDRMLYAEQLTEWLRKQK
jgi:hypothetical protein